MPKEWFLTGKSLATLLYFAKLRLIIPHSSHALTFTSGPGSAQRQAEVLRSEGVEVKEDSMGEFYIDWSSVGWFPAELPSEVEWLRTRIRI